jgi:hypothetical protein
LLVHRKRRSALPDVALVALIVLSCSIHGLSQGTSRKTAKSGPELKIRIVPDKETYSLQEKVFTKTEFTNLTDKTLCFPVPAHAHEIVGRGSVEVHGESLNDGTERQRWLDHHDGGPTEPRERLIKEIEEQWIKLAPNATYETESSVVTFNLDVSGGWRLRGSYHPPECSFNNLKCNESFRATVKSTGCVVPEKFVTAEPVTINVVPAPAQK